MSIPNKKSKSERAFHISNYVLMGLLFFAFLYPVLNVFAISISGSSPILRGEVSFYPKGFNIKSYLTVIENKYIWRSYWNTIQVAAIGCVCTVFMTCVAAYPLAFGDFYGKKFYNYLIVFTFWFSGGLIPTYIVMNNLGLTNTLWALIINSLLSAYYIVVLKSFFLSIPYSLIESAKLDGANDLYILYKIVVPLSKASIATISLWTVVAHWNSFIAPLMYLRDRSMYTLQVVLRDIVLQASGAQYELSDVGSVASKDGMMTIPEQVQNAVVFVSMVPMLIIYPFVQRYFVTGVMLGSVKG